MKLQVFHVVFVAYFVQKIDNSNGKHVHIRIHVPQLIHKHNHKVIIHKKPHAGVKKHVVIHKHNHDHNVKYIPKHIHHHKQEKHILKEQHHKPFNDQYLYEYKPLLKQDNDRNNNENQIQDMEHEKLLNLFNSLNNDELKSSLKTEHVEITQINPQASNPQDRVNVRGSYKVEESNPDDITTTSYRQYDSPFTKEIAKTLTNFENYFQEPQDNDEKYDDNDEHNQGYDDNVNFANVEEQNVKEVILYKSRDEKSTSSE